MSDMSLKQAKDIAERLELVEITLKDTLKHIELSSKEFENSLKKQRKILRYIPMQDKKLVIMKIIVALNVGFVIGLLVAKYILI
jgi:hypothetical protein